MKTIRIGNGAGFAGDWFDAPRLLAEAGALDYLTLEYLAELTMSILAHQQASDPQAGYVADFPLAVQSLVDTLRKQSTLRIITNAGGMNPQACARTVSKILADAGLESIGVAAVTGDYFLDNIDQLISAGETFTNLETGEPIAAIRPRLVSANAYLGARGIVDALGAGARVVITGRVADASLTVGPVVYEFGWRWDNWDYLAAATVAGHLIECGAQATGGMYSNWTTSLPLANVGYPIVEIADNAGMVLTKPEGTDGAVTVETVSEQLVYEIGDPAHYLTPDVDADFSQVELHQEGADRVRIERARGNPAPATYKASLAYHDGYMASGTLVICGRDAEPRARACADMIFKRLRRAGIVLARTNVECLGSGDSLPGIWPRSDALREVVLRISVHDQSREAVERFTRELASLVTSGPSGVTGYAGARVKPHRVLAFWPSTIDRSRVAARVTTRSAKEWLQ